MRAVRTRRVKPRNASVPATGVRQVVEGAVHEILSDGRARVVTGAGETVFCRVPMHVSVPWLQTALARGPVAAELTVPGSDGTPSLWSLFPGPEHDGVVAETVEIAASARIRLVCGASTITMSRQELRARSRDVVVAGSRATRVRGGTVKLN